MSHIAMFLAPGGGGRSAWCLLYAHVWTVNTRHSSASLLSVRNQLVSSISTALLTFHLPDLGQILQEQPWDPPAAPALCVYLCLPDATDVNASDELSKPFHFCKLEAGGGEGPGTWLVRPTLLLAQSICIVVYSSNNSPQCLCIL